MQRDYKISLIRCMATCSIVLCHFLQYYGNGLAFWFNIGVQIFLFMSGYLYGKQENLQKGHIEKNLIKILFDYWIYLIIIIPLYLIFSPDVLGSISNIINLFLCKSLVSGIEHFWFIPCIIFCYLITPILFFSRKKWLEYSSKQLIIVFLVYLLVGKQLIETYTGQNTAWILCYILGYMYGFLFKTKEKNAIAYRVFCTVVIACGILLFLFRIGNEYFVYVIDTSIYWYGNLISYTHAMLGSAIFIVLFSLLQKIELNENRVLTFSDKYSFAIYIVHHIYIQGRLNLENVLPPCLRALNIILIIIIILISGVVLKKISEKVRKIFSEINFLKL